MSDNVVQFALPVNATVPIIEKIVDGKTILCINVDALSPAQRDLYFAGKLLPLRPNTETTGLLHTLTLARDVIVAQSGGGADVIESIDTEIAKIASSDQSGESVGGVDVPSADLRSSLSASGTSPGLTIPDLSGLGLETSKTTEIKS